MSQDPTKYTSQDDLLATGEAFEIDDVPIPKPVYLPTLPGVYINPARTLKPANGCKGFVKLQTNGDFGFNFKLVGGLRLPNSKRLTNTKYPLGKYINTGLRVVMDYSKFPPEPFLTNERDPKTGEFKPVRASEVNKYLRFVGLDPKGLRLNNTPEGFQGTLLDAVMESLTQPVGVRIAWQEETEKNSDGSWPEPVLRTADFKTGTSADGRPIYAAEVRGFIETRTSKKGREYKAFVADEAGTVFKAKAVVEEFVQAPSEKEQ